MDFKEAILNRRTAHFYEEQRMNLAKIKQGLEYALTAPNHKFTFPWKFIVVGDELRTEITEIVAQNFLKKDPSRTITETRAEAKKRINNPAALVVFCNKLTDKKGRLSEQSILENYATVACSIQNFSIYFSGLGYHTKWSTGAFTTTPLMYKKLGLNNEEFSISGFVFVGKSSEKFASQRRPKVDSMVEVTK